MITITSKKFGKTKDGKDVTAFEMSNSNGMVVKILNFGGVVQSIVVQDKNGNPTDVCLGYDDVASYENGTCFYGEIVGRYANRIGGACFSLEGKKYQLQKSPGENNHVHGVFGKRLFDATIDGENLILKYLSPDMEEGYPGNLKTEVCYRLTEDNSLEISYKATTDATTIVNLTNHCYFNLNGQGSPTILNHKVQLNCSYFTEYNDDFSQSGKITSVENTPLDFRKEQTIGSRFNDNYRQFRICTGYDHNMIIDGKENELKLVGSCKSDDTGICLKVFTTEPAIQFYSGNYMAYDPVPHGKNGMHYPKNSGFCMEAQHYPDSINHPNFTNTILKLGEVYTQKTIYKFSK